MAFAGEGYNPRKIKDLMDNIKATYDSLGQVIQQGWDSVSTTMRSNWVGEDQQAFEQMLANRINEMYVSTHGLAQNGSNVVFDLGESWYNFQKNNKLEGSESIGDSTFGIERLEWSAIEKLIEPTFSTITDDMDRGLVSESSGETIKGAVETYKTTIQSKVQELVEAVDVGQAFFGEQTTSIKSFVTDVGSAISTVLTAVKHLYDKIDELTSKQYGTASTTFTEAVSGVSSSMNTDLDNLGESRWN